MSRLELISNLEEDLKRPKKKYQVFEVQMGFERVEVFVPEETSELFEQEALAVKPKSTASLSALLKKFGGFTK